MRQIGVKVNLPETEAGKALLHEAMMGFNAEVLGWGMRRGNADENARNAILKRMGGRVPWASEKECAT